jgi:putative transposase
MIRLRAYKYRLLPNKSQKILLNKTFGCVRYIWNHNVSVFNSYHKENNPAPLFKTSTELRNELEWMKEISAGALQQKEIDFKKYKKERFSKSRKKLLGNPRFKSKSDKQSFRLPNQKFSINKNKIKLEKIGKITFVIDRQLPDGTLLSVTVSKNLSDEYYISILIKTEINELPKTNKSVGIDVGLKKFITTSDNVSISNPYYFRKSQSKLKKLQKHLSRKKKGSNRRNKARLKIAKLYQKIKNQRAWFLHNESINLVRQYDTIVIEDLNIAGMIKNRKLAKSISDASFSKFFLMLAYKSDWYGKTLIRINKFEPTSKKCSSCKWIKKDLTLKDREFNCKNCGLIIDRDYNAALNIYSVGVNAELNQTQRENKTNLLANPDEVFKKEDNKYCY